MNSEADCLDANIDYGHGGGYFVRVDVELPKTGLYGATRPDGGPMGFLSLTDAEADAFAASSCRWPSVSDKSGPAGSTEVPFLGCRSAMGPHAPPVG